MNLFREANMTDSDLRGPLLYCHTALKLFISMILYVKFVAESEVPSEFHPVQLAI